MLVLDIYQNAVGDVTVQYNPQQWESIGQLKSILSNYNIENPLVTFSQRHKGEYYNNVSEEYVQADAWVCDTLGKFWKESDKDMGQPSQNALIILQRMTDAYLDEHYELLELRENCQNHSSHRKKKKKQLRDDKAREENFISNNFIVDPIDINDLYDLANQPTDYYSFGVGLCCSKYSEYLSNKMHVENEICLRCLDEGSDEGVVSYHVPVSYRQDVTVIFTNDEPFMYDVDITVDTYGDEDLDSESLYELLSCKNKRIRIPFTDGSVIEPVIERIEGPMQLCIGVRLSQKLRFNEDAEELSATKMRKIFVTTRAMLQFIEADIKSVT